MMKTSAPIKQHLFFYLIIVAIVSSSCASFQYASYENDRMYDQYGSEAVSYDVSSYQDYFAYKSEQYAAPSDHSESGDVFTDIDAYSSSSVNVDAVNVVSDYGYDYNNSSNYSGWGGNVTNVYINSTPAFNSGWGNWGMGSWAWNNWGWNSWYGGAYNFGRYSPWGYGYGSPWRSGWGWNNWGWGNSWGWNSMFYGPVWAGANYGFFCPSTYYAPAANVYYPSSNNVSPVYVANNTRRGSYSNLTRDNYNISGVTRSSRRGYRSGYLDYEVPGSKSSALRNYNSRRASSAVRSGNNTVRRSNNTYSTRRNSNNSSYNSRSRSNTNTRSTTTRRSSNNTYRSSSPNRSSNNNTYRSSSNRSSNNTYRSSSPSRSRSSGSSFRSSSPSRSSGGSARSSRSGGRGGRM